MTNAEKYLKNTSQKEVLKFVENLTKELSKYDELKTYSDGIEQTMLDFLNKETKGHAEEERNLIVKLPPKIIGLSITYIKHNEDYEFTFRNQMINQEDITNGEVELL